MQNTTFKTKIIEEINLIPEHKFEELYQFIHVFRLGLERLRELTLVQPKKESAPHKNTAKSLLESDFVGMWADRDDIVDSQVFARQLRERSSTRSHHDTP